MPRYALDDRLPSLPGEGRCWIAPDATVIGGVELAEGVGVWFGAVVRGDGEPIVIGRDTNIQDLCVVHTDPGCPVAVGQGCTVGHRAILHGCRVDDGCLIGMQATVLDDAVVGQGSVVGACALVTQRTVIPPRSLVLGAPAKVVRTLTEEDEAFHRALAAKYVRLKENYLRDSLRG